LLTRLFTETGKQVLPGSNSDEITVKESFPTQTQEDNKPIESDNKLDRNLKAVLKSVPHEAEAVEEFEEDWSSDSGDDFVLSEQKSAQRDDINLKLAQNFMFENSGLTQQQILTVIQYQNAVEGEIQQDHECFLSPDQPSTSDTRSKGKALLHHFRGMQAKTSESSYSRTDSGNTPEVICNRNDVDSVSAGICNRRGVSSSAEASCSGSGVSSACDADVLGKWKVDVLNGKIIDIKNSTVRQEVSTTESNDVLVSVLSPVGDIQKDSNNEIQQMNSDHDSDSSSDKGFVEVTDAATWVAHNLTSEKNALELIIRQDKACKIEDDIFADIFGAQTPEGMLTENNNLPEDTIINLSCSDDNVSAGLRGTKNGKFVKEDMRNGINGGKEGNKSMLKEEGKGWMENIKTQDNCRQKDFKVERDIGTSLGVEPGEDSKQQVARTALSSVKPEDDSEQVTRSALSSVKPEEDGKQQVTGTALSSVEAKEDSKQQVTRTTLSSEELQKLQVLALCCCVYSS
jgi:hypothetical protein